LWDDQGSRRAFGEDLSRGTAARTVSRVKGSKSSREKACSQAPAAEEGIGRGSGEITDSYRLPMADQCGTSKTKVSTAPALVAREHGRRLSHVDPLVLVGGPPQPQSCSQYRSTGTQRSPVPKYWHLPKLC